MDAIEKGTYLIEKGLTLGATVGAVVTGIALIIAGGPFTVALGVLGVCFGVVGTGWVGANVIRDFTEPRLRVDVIPAGAT